MRREDRALAGEDVRPGSLGVADEHMGMDGDVAQLRTALERR